MESAKPINSLIEWRLPTHSPFQSNTKQRDLLLLRMKVEIVSDDWIKMYYNSIYLVDCNKNIEK